MHIPGSYEDDLGVTENVPLQIEHELQLSLADLERAGGFTGWIARYMLLAGDWIDRELEERRQAIGGIDNMWLLLSEAADFNPVCACTYTLRDKLSLEQLYHSAERQAEKFPKYRQRVTSVGRRFHGARFENDPDFDMSKHIHAVTLPEPAGKRELDDLMGKFIAQDWDLRRPLWEMVLVENYHDENGSECAVITRGHHSLADGQGFVISQLFITSYHDILVEAMNSTAEKIHAVKRGRLPPSKIHRALRFLDPLCENEFTAPILHLSLASAFWFALIVSTCVSFLWSIYPAIRQATLFLITFWRVEMLTGPQLGPRVTQREFSSSRAFSIDDVKLCQQAFSGPRPGSSVKGVPKEKRDNVKHKAGHVTLNDVVCAVMADVLGAELAVKPRLDDPWEGTKQWLQDALPSPIGFFIPMSIRSPGDWSMRNLSTGALVYLNPTKDASVDPSVHEMHKHIHECRAELSLLKHSLLPKISFYIVQLTGQAPVLLRISLLANPTRRVKDWITRHISKPLYDLVLQSCTVPGPKKRITLEGAEVLTWTALPPQAGKGTIGMGIISYAGGLSIAVAADLVPSTQGVARRICDRFEERCELYVRKAKEVLNHLD
ncbi:hypothetical protein IEO21_04253 [Rhodonia placenta]|uniref:Diacylglycerol O-acyltransferase n=1 Tax=Rhodonia placenta TaxID=104341 RepID=A0A8H7P424_9APHY|nr:hypothetical protein IEO21_04253 [Postia placenta]